MKKLTTVIMVALASAAAFGELSWASVSTAAYSKDSSPSAGTADYTAYLCTVEAAQKQFGANTVAGVTTYFKNNASSGKLSTRAIREWPRIKA